MKKKAVVAGILAASMLFTACSIFDTGSRSRSRRDRDRDDDDDGNGFTRPAVETTEETTAATTTSAAPTAAPTEVTTPASGYSDDVFVDAYFSYREILEANEEEIRAYDWMVFEGGTASDGVMEPTEDCPCALADVTGDTIPDLLIMKAETDYMATLEIYSYDPESGESILIYTEDGFDVLAGGGGRYLIASMDDNCLFIYKGSGDEEWTDIYSIYAYNHTLQSMEIAGELTCYEYLNDGYDEYLQEYYIGDEPISEEDFLWYRQEALEYFEYVLQFNYISDEDMIEYSQDVSHVAFSYDEMHDLLADLVVSLSV